MKERRVRSLGELSAAFVTAFAAGWSERTVDSYQDYLDDLEGFLGAATPLDEISTEDAEKFKSHLWKTKGLSPTTVKSRLDFARRVFQYGVHLNWVEMNPFQGVKPPRGKRVKQPDPFTPEEIHAILATAKAEDPQFYPFLLTMALTGERRNAVRLLDVGDFDPEERVLQFRAETTKQREEIVRPVPQSLLPVLMEVADGRPPEDPLFTKAPGKRWVGYDLNVYTNREKGILRPFGKLLKEAGVRLRGMHNFRSGVDTNLVEAGVNLDKALAVTGHTENVAKESYLRLRLESKRETMEFLAEAYGVNEIEAGEEESTVASAHRYEVELAEDEALLLEKSLNEKNPDSGTDSGTSSRTNPVFYSQIATYGAQSAMSPFGDSRRQSAKADFAHVSTRIHPRAR